MATRIRKLLIANRGEISARIQRTCRRLGIISVAVHSDPDRHLPFVASADESISIGGTSPAESYLASEALIAAAKKVGADAIHPGYGFLSEDGNFADAALQAGLCFIGPPAQVIRRAGSKVEAKEVAREAGVPVVPGVPGFERGLDPATLRVKAVSAFGYPVLIKAAHGGGGRGMRVVEREEELLAQLKSAHREAQASFGDGTLLIERFLPEVRHVEVQIFGDQHGNLVHLFERDCSIQRRHQKLVEETPAPGLPPGTREKLWAAAVEVGRAFGYQNAGTVEFVVDPQNDFYFLEINARLQVEHPVTEATTGVDLVEEQLRVASGEVLSWTQESLSHCGAAIEVRLCAEDPELEHVPASGDVLRFEVPQHERLRVDAAVESGSTVSMHYDSLLAKFIVSGPSRSDAAAVLAGVMEQTTVHGISTNREWLMEALRSPAFVEGNLNTDFVQSQASQISPGRRRRRLQTDALMAAAIVMIDQRCDSPLSSSLPLGFGLDWRMAHADAGQERFQEVNGGQLGAELIVSYRERPTAASDRLLQLSVGAAEAVVRWRRRGDGEMLVEIEGHQRPVRFDAGLASNASSELWLTLDGATFCFRRLPRLPRAGHGEAEDACLAPMASTVREVRCQVGDKVGKGEPLVVLEAMKMEHSVVAPRAAVVQRTLVRVGDRVTAGQVVAELEFAPEPAETQ